MFRTHVYIIVICLLMVESFSFYKIMIFLCICCLSNSQLEAFVALSGAQILVPSGVWLWYYSFPGAAANHSFLLVPSQPSGFYTILGLVNQERSPWAALRSQSMSHMLFCSLLLTVGSYWSSSVLSALQAPGVAEQSAVLRSQQGPGI